jgi:3-hydroxyisobutyrate dehydrogenase-like beta-hydroxyacid dehydrogenase
MHTLLRGGHCEEVAMKIGFIGLGAMGTPLAEALVADGHTLTVYNRTRSRAEPLAARGARVAETPADCAKGCEAVFPLVSDDHALEQVVFEDAGLLRGLERGAIHVSSSTISVALADRLTEAHTREGQQLVSATIFGRPDVVRARKAWFALGGPPAALGKVKPVIEKLGRGVTVAGERPSDANVLKLAGNFMLAGMIELLGEAFALTDKHGLPRERSLEVFQSVFGAGPFASYAALIAHEKFEPMFALKLGFKDVRLALEAGDAKAVPMPVAGVARDGMLSAIANGFGDLDWTALARVSFERAGIEKKA